MRQLPDAPQTRRLTAGLGLAMIAFGVLPAFAPRPFARLFGFRTFDAESASMMRSLGVRDMAMGLGLWSAAAHGGNYAPLLLARALTDGGDVVSVGLAVSQGQRHPRFIGLGALALSAALTDAALYWLARRDA